jgi:hypothetical protein
MSKIVRHSALLGLAAFAAGCAKHSGDATALLLGTAPAFETRLEIETGSATHADYHVADFDGDTQLDVAVISLTGELRVLLGNGTTFTLGQELQLDGLPVWLSGGDFDQDGDEDLVVVRSEANETITLANDGAATFTPAGALEGGQDALAVSVGDLNGDGLLDVAVSLPNAPQLVVGFGDGALGFSSQEAISLPGGGTPLNVAIGDATRDGFDDLVVADSALSRLVVYANNQGTAALASDVCELDVPGTPGGVTFGDLSGDGFDDIVVSAFTGHRVVVITDVAAPQPQPSGAPSCAYQSFALDMPAPPSFAVVGDVTGDGINDLVSCLAFNASVAVAAGVPGGLLADPVLFDSTGIPLRPFIGDFDQNGRADVMALSGLGNRLNLWLADSDGELLGARSYGTTLPTAAWMEGADFDGDGDFEVVTGSNSDQQLVIMGGDDSLEVEALMEIGFNVYQIKAADLDEDGLQDLVVGVPGGLRLLRNVSQPGAYSFEVLPVNSTTIASGNFPFGIEATDLDGDGDVDIVFCDYASGDLHFVPGTSTPFEFGAEVLLNVGGGPVDVAAADFTGDGLKDLAISRINQSDVVILRNEGGSDFAQVLAVPVGLSPNYLITSDFNSDGRADLVVSNASSGTVSVLFGGESSFTGTDYAAGSSPTALLAQDLTGDGIEDILVASLQSGDFRVLVGDGNGSFPLLPTFPGTLGASDAVLQDMNGDGTPELLISSLVTDRISLVRNAKQ